MAQEAQEAETVTVAATQETQVFGSRIRQLWGALRSVGNPLRTFGAALSGPLVNGARTAARGVGNLISGIARIARFRLYRTIIKDMAQSFKDLYGWSHLFGTDFARSMDTITTAFTYLRNSIAAMAAPLVNAIAPALDTIIDWVVEALNWFNMLFATLNGASTYTVAKKTMMP